MHPFLQEKNQQKTFSILKWNESVGESSVSVFYHKSGTFYVTAELNLKKTLLEIINFCQSRRMNLKSTPQQLDIQVLSFTTSRRFPVQENETLKVCLKTISSRTKYPSILDEHTETLPRSLKVLKVCRPVTNHDLFKMYINLFFHFVFFCTIKPFEEAFYFWNYFSRFWFRDEERTFLVCFQKKKLDGFSDWILSLHVLFSWTSIFSRKKLLFWVING